MCAVTFTKLVNAVGVIGRLPETKRYIYIYSQMRALFVTIFEKSHYVQLGPIT